MKANRAGKFAEDVLAGLLQAAGCEFDRQVVIGQSIYGGAYRVDFLIRNLPEFTRGLALESKWQSRDGTVDEKFPYVFENIVNSQQPTIVIVDGGGCNPGALAWLQNRCDGHTFVAVFSLQEFMVWLLRHDTIRASR